MSEELKPCPFCNAMPKQHNPLFLHVRHEEWCAMAIDGERNEIYSIEAWNTRYDRTCRVVSREPRIGMCGAEEAWLLSCGHVVFSDGDFPPNYCDECGAKVVAP